MSKIIFLLIMLSFSSSCSTDKEKSKIVNLCSCNGNSCYKITYNKLKINSLKNKNLQFKFEKCFIDKINRVLIYVSNKRIYYFNLCDYKLFSFQLKNLTLSKVVKIDGNRYFIEFYENKIKTLFEIETDLQILENIEGDLSNFDYQKLDKL